MTLDTLVSVDTAMNSPSLIAIITTVFLLHTWSKSDFTVWSVFNTNSYFSFHMPIISTGIKSKSSDPLLPSITVASWHQCSNIKTFFCYGYNYTLEPKVKWGGPKGIKIESSHILKSYLYHYSDLHFF